MASSSSAAAAASSQHNPPLSSSLSQPHQLPQIPQSSASPFSVAAAASSQPPLMPSPSFSLAQQSPHTFYSASHFSPTPSPQPPAYQEPVASLLEEMRVVDLHRERWNKRRNEVYANTFSLASLQVTLLLVLGVVRVEKNWNKILKKAVCGAESAVLLMIFTCWYVLFMWYGKLQFIRRELSRNLTRRAELQETWNSIKSAHGFSSVEIDDWFIQEPTGRGWNFQILALGYYLSIVLILSKIFSACWEDTKSPYSVVAEEGGG